MNTLNNIILQNTFKTDRKTYLNNQIRVYTNSLKNKIDNTRKLKTKKSNKKK